MLTADTLSWALLDVTMTAGVSVSLSTSSAFGESASGGASKTPSMPPASNRRMTSSGSSSSLHFSTTNCTLRLRAFSRPPTRNSLR